MAVHSVDGQKKLISVRLPITESAAEQTARAFVTAYILSRLLKSQELLTSFRNLQHLATALGLNTVLGEARDILIFEQYIQD